MFLLCDASSSSGVWEKQAESCVHCPFCLCEGKDRAKAQDRKLAGFIDAGGDVLTKMRLWNSPVYILSSFFKSLLNGTFCIFFFNTGNSVPNSSSFASNASTLSCK